MTWAKRVRIARLLLNWRQFKNDRILDLKHPFLN
jgi:hypothetical protein